MRWALSRLANLASTAREAQDYAAASGPPAPLVLPPPTKATLTYALPQPIEDVACGPSWVNPVV